MALIQCSFFSDCLGMNTDVTVILPQETSAENIGTASSTVRNHTPTMWLLHGLSDDHSIWLRRTSIERYVAAMGLAVVMPNVHRSFYSNMQHGGNYWDFVTEELPRICQQFFPHRPERNDNLVVGLSMGGYGAFKLALRCPERFAAAASLSGVLDIRSRCSMAREHEATTLRADSLTNVFGQDLIPADSEDLFKLMEAADPATLPDMLQICGTEDVLYRDNAAFRKKAVEIGVNIPYREGPGVHDWAYWDAEIQTVLRWWASDDRKTI